MKFIFRFTVREPEENRLLVFCEHRQGNKNEMALVEIGFMNMNWMYLVSGSLRLQVRVNTRRYHLKEGLF